MTASIRYHSKAQERFALKKPKLPTEFRDGLKAITPLFLGVASFAIAYGLLARKAGLSLFSLTLMSLLVFAGASQFVAISLLISGSSFLLILFTTFVVNSRYFLMGASLGPYIHRWSTKWQVILSFLLSDESYAMTISYFTKNAPNIYYQLGVSLGLYVEWIAFSIVGGLMGSFLGDPQTWGLDFALPATFIVLLVPMIRTWRHATVCIVTGALSIAGFLFLPAKWYIPVAAVSGTIVGGILELWKRR